MNVHEYQAKELFREFGVAVPEGSLATTPEEAERAAKALGTPVVVVKAQVHAGGRGKGGGVKLAKSPGEAKTAASEILGMTLHTPDAPGKASLSGRSTSRRDPISRTNSTSRSFSIGRRRSSRSWLRPRAAWRSRLSRRRRRTRS